MLLYTVILNIQSIYIIYAKLAFMSSACASFLVPTSLAAVGASIMVSLALPTRGAVRITWSPPTDLCGLTNPQYTIQYWRSTSTLTTHPSMPSSSPFNITGLDVRQQYSVRVAVRTQSGSGNFSSWESVTTYKGVKTTVVHVIFCHGQTVMF